MNKGIVGILVWLGLPIGVVHAGTYNFYFNNTEQGDHSEAKPALNVNGKPGDSGSGTSVEGATHQTMLPSDNEQKNVVVKENGGDAEELSPSDQNTNSEVDKNDALEPGTPKNKMPLNPNTPMASQMNYDERSNFLKSFEFRPELIFQSSALSNKERFNEFGSNWIKIPLSLRINLPNTAHQLGIATQFSLVSGTQEIRPNLFAGLSVGPAYQFLVNDYLKASFKGTYQSKGLSDRRWVDSQFGRNLVSLEGKIDFDGGHTTNNFVGTLEGQYTFGSEALRKMPRTVYAYDYGKSISAKMSLGIQNYGLKLLGLFGAARINSLTIENRINGKARGMRIEKGPSRLFQMGPRIEYVFTGGRIYGEALYNVGKKDRTMEIMGNPRDYGIGRSQIATGISFYL